MHDIPPSSVINFATLPRTTGSLNRTNVQSSCTTLMHTTIDHRGAVSAVGGVAEPRPPGSVSVRSNNTSELSEYSANGARYILINPIPVDTGLMHQRKAWTTFVNIDIAHQSSFESAIVNIRKNWSGGKIMICLSGDVSILR